MARVTVGVNLARSGRGRAKFPLPWHDFGTMGFLKRLLGGSPDSAPDEASAPSTTPAEVEADERAHELDLARSEQDRLSDLQQRQLKYADYAWEPPAQGGTRRADDEDAAKEDAAKEGDA
jgi:hypothetical protein